MLTKKNRRFIDIIFATPQDYITQGDVDILKVVRTLKENGLLHLFFTKPTPVILEFHTSTTPLFFVKLIQESLKGIGYYRYITKEAVYDNITFRWSVTLTSEYATDPEVLQKELAKRGCVITALKRKSPTHWIYTIDASRGHLAVKKLQDGENFQQKHSLDPYWFDVSAVKKLQIITKGRDNWHPYITFFDSMLHIINFYKKEKRIYNLTIRIPQEAKYIKIADLYTPKNLRDGLELVPSGVR